MTHEVRAFPVPGPSFDSKRRPQKIASSENRSCCEGNFFVSSVSSALHDF